jgi:hypothetical protein
VDKVMKLNVKLNVEKCFPLKANPRQQKFWEKRTNFQNIQWPVWDSNQAPSKFN